MRTSIVPECTSGELWNENDGVRGISRVILHGIPLKPSESDSTTRYYVERGMKFIISH